MVKCGLIANYPILINVNTICVRLHIWKIELKQSSLRLVFTSDGVVVGDLIRSVERYDLVKIEPTKSERTPILLMTLSLTI